MWQEVSKELEKEGVELIPSEKVAFEELAAGTKEFVIKLREATHTVVDDHALAEVCVCVCVHVCVCMFECVRVFFCVRDCMCV